MWLILIRWLESWYPNNPLELYINRLIRRPPSFPIRVKILGLTSK